MDIMREVWDFISTAMLRGGMYSLMAVGLALVFGVMNIANFAHGEFYMLGAFFGYFILNATNKIGLPIFIPPILCIAGAGIGVAIVAGIIERTSFRALRKRSKGQWLMNTFLLTLGISIILQNGARLIWGGKYRGVTRMWKGESLNWFLNISLPPDRLIGFFIAVISIVGFVLFLNKTSTGRAIRAVSQDEVGASLVGINLGYIHTLVFSLSGLLAGIAGASLLSVSPAFPFMGTLPLYKSWFVLILVGMGSIGGSIVGGLLLGFLEAFATTYLSQYLGSGSQEFICLTVIIAILLLKPNGIFGKAVKSASE
ncbi:MAG: branched-chain amino acid ABC transporter permease [Deltaproteobacteria bacterium]|jgi:branched-chain amino acid transport system permease protein|nr:branched-chain amino acid ABC transporter permease [Deltaproteobacteria bacterium]